MTQHRKPPIVAVPDPADVAAWVEHRLHECPTVGAAARLYGLELLDPAAFAHPDLAAGRLTFVEESGDATSLVLGPACADAVGRFDAVVLATARWEPAVGPLPRPGGHPVRRRVRVVAVVGESGTATAWRFDHLPERVEVMSGLAAAGVAGVQLAAMWAGCGR